MKLFPLILLSFSVWLPAMGQAGVAAPREELERATAKSALSELVSRPWHAKLGVQVYDAKGKNPVEATIDYWRAGAESLLVIAAGEATLNELDHDGKSYELHSGSPLPDRLRLVANVFLHSGPSASDMEKSVLDMRKQKFGAVELDCFMLSQPLKGITRIPLGFYPTYCVDPTSDIFRLSLSLGRQVMPKRIGHFLDHDVPVEFSVTEDGTTVATAKLSSIGTFVPTAETFVPGPQMALASHSVALISNIVAAGNKIGGTPPSYPASARANHVSGQVILRTLIGRDGHVSSLQVMSTPDIDLAIAALAAVRTWVYKPFLLNGAPTDVDTTVIVNFNLNVGASKAPTFLGRPSPSGNNLEARGQNGS